ncbi:MAG: alkaline phosphatase family protein [Peptostreptococcus sp.]|uniref:alkaline phosphatase family protein n=1 Tax=Peptostreptococcus sp. TaxID=1262 RepID=UPI002FC6787F
MIKKYLHILSYDGLSKVDIDKLKKLPNFKKYLKEASGCLNVTSVYPSLTYCAHTSITTGVYPNKHRIISNTKLEPYRKSPDWHWYDRDIKAETFQSLAKKAGYKILSIFWPVTAASKDIKYNMPEIFANRWWKKQSFVSLFNGNPYFQFILNSKFGKLRNALKEPELDNFSHQSFLYSLEHFKADINMIHYIDLDSQRHEFGFNSKEADEALVRLDIRLGEIIDKLKEIGIYKDSVIVVLGDHSSKDGHSNIYLNSLLYKANLLEKNEDKTVKSFKVISKSLDGSAYIYGDESIGDEEILNILDPLLRKKVIEKVYTGEEAGNLGADPSCRFMLEASEGYFFAEGVEEEVIARVEKINAARKSGQKKVHVNNHGYSPTLKENYETVFLISGKGIKRSISINEMSLIDEGPTFARVMGLDMKNCDGRVIEEFLEE